MRVYMMSVLLLIGLSGSAVAQCDVERACLVRLRLQLLGRLSALEGIEPFARDRLDLADIRAELRLVNAQLSNLAVLLQRDRVPYPVRGYYDEELRGGVGVGGQVEPWAVPGGGSLRDCPVCPRGSSVRGSPDRLPRALPDPAAARSRVLTPIRY